MSHRSAEQMPFGLLGSLMCAQACFAFSMHFFVIELMLKRSGKISIEFLASKGGLHCEHMESQRSIAKNVAADAMHDSMSLDV